MTTELDWEQRMALLWAAFDEHEPTDFLAKVRAMVAELPPGDANGLFELASAHDSIGEEEPAVSFYRQALAAGMTGPSRRRAVIQMASTLRNLGQAEESVALLMAERKAGTDELDDAVTAFLALALVDTGKEREAVGLALGALSRHLPRYARSLTNYAKALSGAR